MIYVLIIGTDSPVTEASTIFQHHIDTLSQCLINPVKVSQLLFSERCISEETLDEMEKLEFEGALDEKKTTLLSAIHSEVSSDHKKLKVLVTVLSKFDEMKLLSERIISEYGERSINNLQSFFIVDKVKHFQMTRQQRALFKR